VTSPIKILSIAGSDSGGGAGIQADLKTIAALGCYGMTAITALTAQNTKGVFGIHAPDPGFLGQQLDAVFEDIGADAVKIGMLHSPEIVRVVASALNTYRPEFVVLDPVMVATSGDTLITQDCQQAIIEELFPLATIVTPNMDELSLLIGSPVTRPDQFLSAADTLLTMGAQSVLVKGGHLASETLIDLFVEPRNESNADADRTLEIRSQKVHTRNLHGTGCTLSSAIACFLGLGYPIRAAVRGAHDYVYAAIQSGATLSIGQGHGPVNHNFDPHPMKPQSRRDPHGR
jgi:hydroxymethylpyrimidine/phosphomethylpyrimidine kinase